MTWLTVACRWVKKQWKLCIGFLVGIFSVLLITRKNNNIAEILEGKGEAEKKITEAEEEAKRKSEESLRKNLDIFFEKNEEIDLSFKKRLEEIKENEKKKINEILESDDPNDLIARKLKDFLDS